jgi:holo-[acyl-carrier protein] synthase
LTAHIIGIGIDMVSIPRIARAMKNPRFISRVLRSDEIPSSVTTQWLAGRWAAKEAVSKALGTHLTWHDVSINYAASGKPTVQLHVAGGEYEHIIIHLSISHERSDAIAMVVAEKLDRRSDTI